MTTSDLFSKETIGTAIEQLRKTLETNLQEIERLEQDNRKIQKAIEEFEGIKSADDGITASGRFQKGEPARLCLSVLKEFGSLSLSQIRAKVNLISNNKEMSDTTVRRACQKLQEDGKIKELDNGNWKIVAEN